MDINKFNLRVYGLLIRESKVLISKETLKDFGFTKFPGGGLDYGEGLEDGLKREFMEELQMEITLKGLFYVNEFFQQSAFKKNEQVISFYYIVEPLNNRDRDILESCIKKGKFDISPNQSLEFYWAEINKGLAKVLTFPIDKIVADKLVSETWLSE